MGRWRVLEEIALADCALEIHGESLDDLFETSVRAVADVMVDPASVDGATERTLSLSAPSLDLLYYDFLSELIYLKDAEQLILTRGTVRVERGEPWRLAARLVGGGLEAGRTTTRADAKAVTLHRFAVERLDGEWRARVVIDI